MVYGISGRLSSTFTAQFLGDWANNEGSFIENFQFSTGKNQIRKWNLIIDSNGKIIGTADDIIGKAVGQQYGSAVMLSYKLKLSEDLGGHVIKVIDWMHLLENLLAVFLSPGFGRDMTQLVGLDAPSSRQYAYHRAPFVRPQRAAVHDHEGAAPRVDVSWQHQ